MIHFVLKCCQQILHYFGPFPELTKIYLQKLLGLWVHPESSIRAISFLNIYKIATDLPYPYINMCLKGTYLSLVHNTTFYTPKTELVDFMCKCIVELYGIDFVASCQHASVYLRHISVQLREAHIAQSKRIGSSNAHENIYNWQTIHSIHLWVKVLCAHPNQDDLWLPLAHPLFQILHGLITLVPTSSYYPIRCHCVRMMNQMVIVRNSVKPLFLNPTFYLMEMLNYCVVLQQKKFKSWKGEQLNFQYILKVGDRYMATKAFMDSIVDEIHINLLTYLCCYDRSVSFPELAVPVLSFLKHCFASLQIVSPSLLKLKSLYEAVEQTSKLLSTKLNEVNFAPNDIQKVDQFPRQFKQPTPLQKYHQKIQKHAQQPNTNKGKQQELEEELENDREINHYLDELDEDELDDDEVEGVDQGDPYDVVNSEEEEEDEYEDDTAQTDNKTKKRKL
eukprot:TRINITY_DN18173_c0_g1_i1.p1 TRINITY_DN18173_c0_g1~~TRINITY_DN18173_c0_g1_i1.p1  ORF type:complete len:464 (+),score=61.28 TRINITY_DN18173_c0_g1_i1:49-1392(+)